MILAGLTILIMGSLFTLLSARRRRWIDALLVLLATLSLAALVSDWPRSAVAERPLTLITDGASAEMLTQGAVLDMRTHPSPMKVQEAVQQAASIRLQGHGLSAAQWRELPSRPLHWDKPASDVLWLDFPRRLSVGRPFVLTVRRAQAQANWRLQLLAENDQVLAQAVTLAKSDVLSLEWLPPLAERLLLRARLLDAAGRILAEGPLPLLIEAGMPLQIKARFDAASFDTQSLQQLLRQSGALLDWQVTLGKTVTRQEIAFKPLDAVNLYLVDAAYLEHLGPPARAKLMAQVAQGVPLLILAGNASEQEFWRREFGLPLTVQADARREFHRTANHLILNAAGLRPNLQVNSPWSATASDAYQQPWLWQRPWQKGRIVWLAVTDWHRYAITAPTALGLWWQDALDSTGMFSQQGLQWDLPDLMPQPNQAAQICARGAERASVVRVDEQQLQWQTRAEQADAVCAAFWPVKSGWLPLQASDTAAVTQSTEMYVYASTDWPAWQQALRQDATSEYAARLPEQKNRSNALTEKIIPSWLCALVFVLCMLGLWWRERR